MKQYAGNYEGASKRVEFNVSVSMMNEAEMRKLLNAILVRASRDDEDSLNLFTELLEAEFSAFGPEGQISQAGSLAAFKHAEQRLSRPGNS